MSVTPKVYRLVPGAKTPAAIIDGVKRVMDFAGGVHHWEIVDGSYDPGVSITLQDKATSGMRRLRLTSAPTGTPSPTIDCHYSRDGGANESVNCWVSGGATIYPINNPLFGVSTTEAYVIELEDAITIVGAKGADGGTSLVANGLCMGVHAGRIFSAHNKSDAAIGAGEEGMLCGQLMVYNTSPWSMLSASTGLGGGQANGTQGVIWDGVQYIIPRIADIQVSTATGLALTQWRDSRPDAANAYTLKMIENAGDNQSIERLVPYPISGPISGVNAKGHFGYTRYIRARKFGFGDTALGELIDNATVLQSAGDPNIGWRHNYGYNATNTRRNTIHIWCPPGAEVDVPT